MKKDEGIKEWDGQHTLKEKDMMASYEQTPLKRREVAI